MKIVNVVGARPNFMKISTLMREMRHNPEIVPVLVHTGQHYDVSFLLRTMQDSISHLDRLGPNSTTDVWIALNWSTSV